MNKFVTISIEVPQPVVIIFIIAAFFIYMVYRTTNNPR